MDFNELELSREIIYEGLNEMIPDLKRRFPTHRNCEESGMNYLLDALNIIQHREYAQVVQIEGL